MATPLGTSHPKKSPIRVENHSQSTKEAWYIFDGLLAFGKVDLSKAFDRRYWCSDYRRTLTFGIGIMILPKEYARRYKSRLRSYHLIVYLGSADRTVDSADRAVDSALAADLGLRLVHVNTSRTEEIADTVMGSSSASSAARTSSPATCSPPPAGSASSSLSAVGCAAVAALFSASSESPRRLGLWPLAVWPSK
ncbi:hypothetical protein LR48_Vigan09g078000 [Vigna angularis]|uniref:Uncharacterized protein n=1 Tax=Phaseolus angularis TaxID=3914 RepID=A0A0L9VAM8_PHAAN|nr:hypothetical protein LR48_Vigan09g078000 [Vigna angularis]